MQRKHSFHFTLSLFEIFWEMNKELLQLDEKHSLYFSPNSRAWAFAVAVNYLAKTDFRERIKTEPRGSDIRDTSVKIRVI